MKIFVAWDETTNFNTYKIDIPNFGKIIIVGTHGW